MFHSISKRPRNSSCKEDCPTQVGVGSNPNLRAIYLFGEINPDCASELVSLLHILNSSKGDIYLYISSGGGDEYSGWTIYDALRMSPNKIIGICYGQCMSIAVLILQACDSRLSSENCRFMLHNGSHGSGDTSLSEFQESAKESGTLTDLYYKAVHEKSNITKDQLAKLCTNVSYFGADIACGYGLIDGIVTPKDKTAKKRTKNATK